MKKAAIVALVCINAVLFVATVFGTGAEKANAQSVRGGTDYLVVTGKIQTSQDAIYVIDTASRSMLAWRFEQRGTSGKLRPFRLQDLKNDFGTPDDRRKKK